MSTSLIGFLVALALAALLVFPLAKPLRAHPWAFYAGTIALTALYVWAVWTRQDLTGVRGLCMVMQKGYLASILLAVVMFTGCFDEGTPVRKRLQPIRGELSILSFILIVGHLCMYLPGYLPRLGTLLSSHTGIAVSLIVAIVLTALFAVLAATSFRAVRRAMNPRAWKGLQRLAYVMVALLAAHVWLVLGSSAIGAKGIAISTVSFIAYCLVIVAYAVLRIRKAVRDAGRRKVAVPESPAEAAAD